MWTIGPAKYLPTAITPVTIANINIGLAPEFAKRGTNHCWVPNSVTAVNVIHAAIKRNNGVNNDFMFRVVFVSIFSDSGNKDL